MVFVALCLFLYIYIERGSCFRGIGILHCMLVQQPKQTIKPTTEHVSHVYIYKKNNIK